MRGNASVIIDSREPQVMQAAIDCALATTAGITRFTTALETGDFVIRDGCTTPCLAAIERKRVADLLGSFRSGRLDKQLTRLKRQYTYPILVVEGSMHVNQDGHIVIKDGRKTRTTKWSHASVQMYLWALQRREGFSVLYTAGIPETADLVRILARRASEGCVAHLEIATTTAV
jgi:ERCC4-type nuclease